MLAFYTRQLPCHGNNPDECMPSAYDYSRGPAIGVHVTSGPVLILLPFHRLFLFRHLLFLALVLSFCRLCHP